MLDFPTDEIHLYPLLKDTSGNTFDTAYLQNIYVKNHLEGVKTSNIPLKQLISLMAYLGV